MRTILFVIVFFFSLTLRAEGEEQGLLVQAVMPVLEPVWLDLSGKMPVGIPKAFFLTSKTESCLVIFTDESLGGEVRFSTGRLGSGKDVVITRQNGRVSYRNGAGKGLVKPTDPVFKYCAGEVKKAEEFTPELKARFHGFAGIK